MVDASALLDTTVGWLTSLDGWQAALLVGGALIALHEAVFEIKHRAVRALPEWVPRLPLIGHAYAMSSDRTKVREAQLKVLAKHYKEGVAQLFIGTTPNVSVFSAEYARLVLSPATKHIEKGLGYSIIAEWLGDGLLLSYGDKWRSRRRLITPTFHFEVLQQFCEVMNEQADIFVRSVHEKAKHGEAFDLYPFLTLAALDIICETAMGIQLNAQTSHDSAYVSDVYRSTLLVAWRISRPWLINPAVYRLTSTGREWFAGIERMRAFTQEVIKRRRQEAADSGAEHSGRRKAFLDLLLDDSTNGLTDEDIREEVDTFMFEGHDTTSSGMSFAIWLLGTHPEVQRRAREEVDRIMVGDYISYEDAHNSFKYLEMVIKESLRLFPPVPFFARHLSEDLQMGPYVIPAGTSVSISTTMLHMNPLYWERPEEFDPERFSPENSRNRDPYAYLPFSAGSRNCIGQKFAFMEEKIMLAKLLRNFEIESVDKENLPSFEIILRASRGVRVRLTPRHKTK